MTRINHNISAMITGSTVRATNRDLAKSLEKLSTGLRINRASDDAAGLSISEQLRTQVRGTGMAIRNANDGLALLKIAEGAANEISSILQRMRELSIQSANDTLTTVERSYTNTEFQHLMSEIQRITNSAQYNGMTLLDGRAGSFGNGSVSMIHIGANNNGGDISGTTDSLKIAITGLSLTAMGLALEADTTAASPTSVSTGAAAFGAITSIDGALRSVNTLRSNLGAYMNRIESAINNLEVAGNNMSSAESTIRDVDFAEETTKFTKDQILLQAGTAMLSQANQLPQMVLQLLK